MKPELLNHFQSKHKSVEERIADGKALRKKFPRLEHGEYKPSSKRTDPVAVLEEQAKTRIHDLVPIRYARMLTSPFAFLRGGAAIMAAVSSYRKKMKTFATMGNLELWYSTIGTEEILNPLSTSARKDRIKVAGE